MSSWGVQCLRNVLNKNEIDKVKEKESKTEPSSEQFIDFRRVLRAQGERRRVLQVWHYGLSQTIFRDSRPPRSAFYYWTPEEAELKESCRKNVSPATQQHFVWSREMAWSHSTQGYSSQTIAVLSDVKRDWVGPRCMIQTFDSVWHC